MTCSWIVEDFAKASPRKGTNGTTSSSTTRDLQEVACTGVNPASDSQEHPTVAPVAGRGDKEDELLELLHMEAEGLQVSWNQHGGRSIAKQLVASDGPP